MSIRGFFLIGIVCGLKSDYNWYKSEWSDLIFKYGCDMNVASVHKIVAEYIKKNLFFHILYVANSKWDSWTQYAWMRNMPLSFTVSCVSTAARCHDKHKQKQNLQVSPLTSTLRSHGDAYIITPATDKDTPDIDYTAWTNKSDFITCKMSVPLIEFENQIGFTVVLMVNKIIFPTYSYMLFL